MPRKSQWFKVEALLELDQKGVTLVDSRMETSKEGVFAAGDVIQKTLRQIVTAAGEGAVAADSFMRFSQRMST
ncbi:MAG: FAD-dependent oxidoreductase [Thermodesulfobacteriota bacterium]